MYFLRLWLRWLCGGACAVLVEWAWLGLGFWFVLAAFVTVAVVAGVSWLIWGDWRAARSRGIDYRYEIIRQIRRH